MDSGTKAIKELIADLGSERATLTEREESFREIVTRFQDMAFACAYAVLRDFWLAQDVAQEAFIIAWRKLDQVQDPDAFPGWFRRIVINECHRLTRGKKLWFVPIEAADDEVNRGTVGSTRAGHNSDPHARLELDELRDRVRRAIDSLPEHERLVTTLFYISEYSQNQISAFLELPVSTVVKRLYTARQRLKKRMIEMFKDELQSHRPSRDESFARRVSARLRPYVAGSDWGPIKEFAYAVTPDLKQDEEEWLRNRSLFDESRFTRRHYVAEHFETGKMLGYGSIEQTIFLPRYRLFLVAEPTWLNSGVGDLLLDQLMADLQEAGAIKVWHRNFSNETETIDFLIQRGFVETVRVWDLRLDLSTTDVSRFASLSEQLVNQGVTITNFAEERQRFGETALHQLHEFLNSVKQDDPERQPFVPAPFDSVVHWFTRDYVRADACFIAKHGDEYIGFTDLNHIEPIPRGIMHGFTGVARNWRRRGIATALKLRAFNYAREHGFQNIRAFNFPSQRDAIALNMKLGFDRVFGYVTLERFVKPVAQIDPSAYDDYVGTYEIDQSKRSENELPTTRSLTIKRVGDRLISELRDMLDELFPESRDVFFTDHHFARLLFGRDQSGAVSHLTYCEDGREIKATRVCETER